MRQDVQSYLFIDEDTVPSVDFGVPFTIKERPCFTREAALAIEAVARTDTSDLNEMTLSSLLDSRQYKRLKMETPLLSDDEDVELQLFKQKDDFEIPFSHIKFPVEPVDGENDQGLGWPTRFRELAPSWMKEISDEKLSVGSEIIYFLKRNPSKIVISEEESARMWSSILTRPKA
jgi:hypothetical protein